MKRVVRIGFSLWFVFALAACREKTHSIAQPNGIRLPALATAVDPPAFAPAGGHYAELILSDGQWQGFIDGKSMGKFRNRDQISGFSRSFNERSEINGLHPEALISAEGKAPVSQIKTAILGLATGGIGHLNFHVRTFSGKQESASYHAVPLDISCHHCRSYKYLPNPEPLSIVLTKNGFVQQNDGGVLTNLDDPDADGRLPGLDAALVRDAARVRGGNLEPVVRVLLDDATPYQRFVDVLCRLHNHGMVPEWTDPDDKSEDAQSE